MGAKRLLVFGEAEVAFGLKGLARDVGAYREGRRDCQSAQGVALDDWEGYWAHYAILKDLLPSAIAHLHKGEVTEALALLSKALSALEEGEKKLGGGARPPGGLREQAP